MTVAELLTKARNAGTVVPAFNIPYLPMMAPTVQALRDTNSFGLIAVARLEWVKFEARSIEGDRGGISTSRRPAAHAVAPGSRAGD